MRALKAKRRFIRWARYQHRCERLAGLSPWTRGALLAPRMRHPMLKGYVVSSWDWSHARRYAPIGIREVRDPVTGVRY